MNWKSRKNLCNKNGDICTETAKQIYMLVMQFGVVKISMHFEMLIIQ